MNSDDCHESKNSHFLRPYWISDDAALEDYPENLRAALEGVVQPGYQDLVAAAPNALERLTAMSAVHLSHLEVLDQIELGKELATIPPEERVKRVDGHLRLVAAKLKAAAFLHRLHKARGGPDMASVSS